MSRAWTSRWVHAVAGGPPPPLREALGSSSWRAASPSPCPSPASLVLQGVIIQGTELQQLRRHVQSKRQAAHAALNRLPCASDSPSHRRARQARWVTRALHAPGRCPLQAHTSCLSLHTKTTPPPPARAQELLEQLAQLDEDVALLARAGSVLVE